MNNGKILNKIGGFAIKGLKGLCFIVSIISLLVFIGVLGESKNLLTQFGSIAFPIAGRLIVILAIITAVCIVLALFGSYVVQIHYLCNHERTDRALRLMFSHYFIVIALNIITVSLKFLENPKSSSVFTAGLMIAGIILFYVTLFSNNTYYHGIFSFGKKDICYSTAVHLTGAVLMLLFNTKVYILLLGAIIVTGSNFVTILMKYKSSMYLLKYKVDEGNL